MRCAVAIAVPDGASTFWSWCSSMISAVSKYGAASSANRIISTAPIAKFGRDDRIGRRAVEQGREIARARLRRIPSCRPPRERRAAAHQCRFSRAASSTVKSTATSASASRELRGFVRDGEVGTFHAQLTQRNPALVRVDRGNQLACRARR